MMGNIELVVLLLIIGAPVLILVTAEFVVRPAILFTMSKDGRGNGCRIIGTMFSAPLVVAIAQEGRKMSFGVQVVA